MKWLYGKEAETAALDAHAANGGIVYRCHDCDFRGWGRPATLHTSYHPGHRLVNERELKSNAKSKKSAA